MRGFNLCNRYTFVKVGWIAPESYNNQVLKTPCLLLIDQTILNDIKLLA